MEPVILGISGASGIRLSFHALHLLTKAGVSVELVMTKDACLTALEELGKEFQTPEKIREALPEGQREFVRLWKNNDFLSPIASGSYLTQGMLILPCSMATLAAVRIGLSDSLLRRAADVTLKEGRKLIVVPREAPFHATHLENMLDLQKKGVTIHPPVPAWYAHPASLEEMELYLVHRILDQLPSLPKLEYARWPSQ